MIHYTTYKNPEQNVKKIPQETTPHCEKPKFIIGVARVCAARGGPGICRWRSYGMCRHTAK